jgi:uncharacterized ferredoxin-like protein
MAIIREEQITTDILKEIASLMMVAARTAPKARGRDNLEIALLTGKDICLLSDKMKELGNEHNLPPFIRDAENILKSHAILLVGTRIKTSELKYCGLCGLKNCSGKEKHPNTPCVFNTIDLGIAIGSAVSIAADHRADNRIMYTIGMAAKELNILTKDVQIIFGIPLSSTAKNPFFDRI